MNGGIAIWIDSYAVPLTALTIGLLVGIVVGFLLGLVKER